VSMETGEDFWVQYYDGSTWRTVATLVSGTHFSNGPFYNVTVSIPKSSYNYPTNAKLRFMGDASNNSDDVYIDEIQFRGLGSGAASTMAAGVEVSAPGAIEGPAFGLAQNYPNPFERETVIRFSLPAEEEVNIAVFDVTGRRVATVADGSFTAGDHRVRWDARSVSTGIYFYRIRAGENVATRRMMVR